MTTALEHTSLDYLYEYCTGNGMAAPVFTPLKVKQLRIAFLHAARPERRHIVESLAACMHIANEHRCQVNLICYDATGRDWGINFTSVCKRYSVVTSIIKWEKRGKVFLSQLCCSTCPAQMSRTTGPVHLASWARNLAVEPLRPNGVWHPRPALLKRPQRC